MSTGPNFAGTAVNNAAALTPTTLDTSLTAPTHTATIFTAGSSGSKVEEISIQQVATTSAAGVINIFLYDGTTYWLFDQYTFAAFTLSTTAEAVRSWLTYSNLILKSGWSIRLTVTVAAGQSAFCVTAFGGDL